MIYLREIIKSIVGAVNALLACVIVLCIFLKKDVGYDFTFYFAATLFIANTLTIFTL